MLTLTYVIIVIVIIIIIHCRRFHSETSVLTLSFVHFEMLCLVMETK